MKNNKYDKLYEANIVDDVVKQINKDDIKEALKNRREKPEDESLSGGFWDLAFDEVSAYISMDVWEINDTDFLQYELISDAIYCELIRLYDL